jgi:hypothetical protein
VSLELVASLHAKATIGGKEHPVDVDVQVEPEVFFRLVFGDIDVGEVVDYIARELGFAQPDLAGTPFEPIYDLVVDASLGYYPIGKAPSGKATIEGGLEFKKPLEITVAGIKICVVHGVVVDFVAGSFSFGGDIDFFGRRQIVEYPFPEPAPPPPPLIVFDYLGLGQRLSLPPSQETDIGSLVEQMAKDLAPFAGDEFPQTILDYYNPNAGWLFGIDLSVRDTFRLQAIFNDPLLYGLQLSISKTGPAKGLRFEILYKKISDDVGQFYAELTLPDVLRTLQFGAVSVTLPVIAVGIYTNGDFRIALGWPLGDRSMTIQVLPFTGSGGFYFAKLSSATDPALPAPPPGYVYDPALGFGIAFSIGLGKQLNVGILSASLSLSLFGVFEGKVAWLRVKSQSELSAETAEASALPALLPTAAPALLGDGLSLSGPDYFWFRGTFGIIGIVQGSVDFVIVKASVSLVLQASATITFETGKDTTLVVYASVSVSVSVEIGGFSIFGIRISITISFSFHADLTQTFVISSGSGQGNELTARAGGHPLRPLRLSPMELPRFEQKQTLPLVYAPQLTVVEQVPQFVTTLTISTVPDEVGTSPFERLVRSLGEWVVWHYVEDTTHTPPPDPLTVELGYESLQDIADKLRASHAAVAEATIEIEPGDDPLRILDYRTIVRFLAANFETTLALQPEQSAAGDAAPGKGALFPIPAELELIYTGLDQWRSFAAYNTRDATYRQLLQQYMAELLLVAANGDAGLALAEDEPPSIAMLVFEDYFRILIESIFSELITLVHRPGEDDGKPEQITLADGLAKLDLGQLAGRVSRYLQHGLRIPVAFDLPRSDWWKLKLAGIFDLTGQQFPITPPGGNPPPAYSVSLRASSGSWLTCSPAELTVTLSDRSQLEQLAQLKIDPAVVSVGATPGLRSQPRSFTLTTPTSWQRGTTPVMLYDLPGPLIQLAARDRPPLSLAVTATEPEAAAAEALLFQAATVVQLTLRRVRSTATGNVSRSGGSNAFVPFVYEVGGANEENRRLLDDLLEDEERLGQITGIALGYPASSTGGKGGLVSDSLAGTTVLVKTNLSTTSNPQAFAALRGPLAGDDERYWAGLDDPTTFLRLLWECSIVNSGGFYLRYETADGEDLPASLFDAGTDVPLAVIVRYGGLSDAAAAIDSATSTVIVASASNAAVYAAPLEREELQPVLDWDAAVPAGCVGFEVVRRNPRNGGSPGWQTETANLFNLVQYRVASGGDLATRDSPWGPPVGPGSENQGQEAVAAARAMHAAGAMAESGDWQYRQAVAAYRFASDGQRYDLVGAAAGLDFRISDVFGNLLADSDQIPPLVVKPLYEDRLTAVGDWPGVALTYQVESGSAGAELTVAASFDSKSFIGPDRDASRAAAALAAYGIIVDQLTDPHGVSASLTTSLAPGRSFLFSSDKPTESLTDRLAEFAKAVLAYLQDIAGGHPSIAPAPLLLSFPVDGGAQPLDVFELLVSLSLERKRELVDPEALELNPAAAVVSSLIPAQITDGVSAFAKRFEEALAGVLKVAAGAPPAAARPEGSAGATESSSLWAIRLGPGGIDVHTSTPWCYYAPPPLSTTLLSNSWLVRSYRPVWNGNDSDFTTARRTFADVDLDLWASRFLSSFDALLAPQLAAPLAVLARDIPPLASGPASSTLYDQLLQSKQRIADCIRATLTDVYVDQHGAGIEQAQEVFGQQLLISLASAYSVSAVAQVPLDVVVPAGHQDPPANLYGVVAASEQRDSADVVYSTAKIPVAQTPAGEQPALTFLVSPADPTAQDVVAQPLTYKISFLEHDLASGAAGEYLESSWLKFVCPNGPDGKPDPRLELALDDARVPIPYRRFPASPTLADQEAKQKDGDTLADARQWTYAFTYQQQDISQDAVWATSTYNYPVEPPPSAIEADLAGEERPLPTCLFEALARVEAEWAAVASHFDAIPAAIADPSRKDEAVAAIRRAAELVNGVGQTWQRPVAALETVSAGNMSGLDPVVTDFWIHEEDLQQTGDKRPLLTLRAYRRKDGAWPDWPEIDDFDGPSNIQVFDDYRQAEYLSKKPATPLRTRRFALSANDVIRRQNGIVSLLIERNAELDDRKTKTVFVYRTPEITPPSPIAPRNALDVPIQLDQEFPAPTLPGILSLFLSDLFGVSEQTPPLRPSLLRHPLERIRYRSRWSGELDDLGSRLLTLEACAGVLLSEVDDKLLRASDPAVLASVSSFKLPADSDPNDPGSYVCQLAARVAAHYKSAGIRVEGGALLLSLTVFSNFAKPSASQDSPAAPSNLLPLLTLAQLEVALPQPLNPSWWGPGAGRPS